MNQPQKMQTIGLGMDLLLIDMIMDDYFSNILIFLITYFQLVHSYNKSRPFLFPSIPSQNKQSLYLRLSLIIIV